MGGCVHPRATVPTGKGPKYPVVRRWQECRTDLPGLDVCGSVYCSTVLTEKSKKMQQCIKILLFLILNEAEHVSGDTPPIVRSLKLHKQPLVLHNTVEGCRTCSCWTSGRTLQRPTTAHCA